MKKQTLIMVLLLAGLQFFAQGQSIFNQNATQRKYMLEQIAALKVYINYAQKGYTVVKDGTGTISNIKNGDLSLHRDHFNSRRTVKSSISGDEKVKSIRAMYADMISGKTQTLKKVNQSGLLTATESAELSGLYNQLQSEASKDIDELDLVLTNGKLDMTDDERLEEINRIYLRIQEKYAFQKNLNLKITGLIGSRQRSAKDADIMRKLYGIGQ